MLSYIITRTLIYGLPHKLMLKIYSYLIKQQFIKYIGRWLNSKGPSRCKLACSYWNGKMMWSNCQITNEALLHFSDANPALCRHDRTCRRAFSFLLSWTCQTCRTAVMLMCNETQQSASEDMLGHILFEYLLVWNAGAEYLCEVDQDTPLKSKGSY